MINWSYGLSVWMLGWGLIAATLTFVLKMWSLDGSSRSETAPMRSLWASKDGRSKVLFVMFLAWPIFVPMLIFAVVIWVIEKMTTDDEPEEDDE